MTESPEDDRLDTAPNGREPALVTVTPRTDAASRLS